MKPNDNKLNIEVPKINKEVPMITMMNISLFPGGITTTPGQGENPFILAHTGSPIRNLN